MDWWYDCAAQLDQVINNFARDPNILAQAASCLFLAGRYDRALETLDQAIEIAPPSDRILWQSASYRRRLGNTPRAVKDLLRLLEAQIPQESGQVEREDPGSPELDTTPLDTADPLTPDYPGIDHYAVSAFQQLRRLAPNRIQEAMNKPRIQQLSPDTRQALLADAPVLPLSAEQEQNHLRLIQSWIRERRWQSAIALLEKRFAEQSSTTLVDLVCLAMAYWGCGNDAGSTELCQSARELILKGSDPASMVQNYGVDDLQDILLWSLIFWRAGDAITALKLLDRCDELLAEVSGGSLFSWWRFDSVSPDLFQEDCELQRKMIERKAAIRPFFLGQAPS
jgi:tetratricopeptide (TPR) repeat protein